MHATLTKFFKKNFLYWVLFTISGLIFVFIIYIYQVNNSHKSYDNTIRSQPIFETLNLDNILSHNDPITNNMLWLKDDNYNDNLPPNYNLTTGEKIITTINTQLNFGPRYSGSIGHKKTQDFITTVLTNNTNVVIKQSWTDDSGNSVDNLTNIIGRFNATNKNRIIIGTHYDSRQFADSDSTNPKANMPGANDSASGVAILLELSSYISRHKTILPFGIDIVFFDGEEGKKSVANSLDGWNPQGSTYFAKNLKNLYPHTMPKLGIILDMVCDKNLNITYDVNSLTHAKQAFNRFWQIGQLNDIMAFNKEDTNSILDDHTPLNNAGIPSMLIIDFDYPWFHTSQDTLDKCSPKSLQTINNTLMSFIDTYR